MCFFPFVKDLLIPFTISSLCITSIRILVVSRFGFKGGTLVMIASVPGRWLHFTFYLNLYNYLNYII